MRALLVLLSAVFLLSACAKEVQLVSTPSDIDSTVVEEQASVELRLSKADLLRFTDVEDGIWKEARTAGLIKVCNKILNKDLLLIPTPGGASLGGGFGEYTESGMLTTESDSETGDTVQTFMVSASFAGDLASGGQILTLEEDRFIAGSSDIAYAMLYQAVPESVPSHVVIAEPAKELGSSFLRVIGMAEIKQIKQGTVALPKEQGGTTGTLCTLEILVSNREIEAGDRIFLMNVDVAALEPGSTLAEGEPETVVVMPPSSDKVQEPSETK
ncbi:hypothetical protein [Desulfomicrobium escambiense]|uniref:hypothetical protein n=1 Tax=Desulfomicrobium escambiense TaxID=29503 RepID=UPI00040F5E57|nr:hypothetical protein [Desulfomicrobium escambiense]